MPLINKIITCYESMFYANYKHVLKYVKTICTKRFKKKCLIIIVPLSLKHEAGTCTKANNIRIDWPYLTH